MATLTAAAPNLSSPFPPLDAEPLYEIVDGQRSELPPMSFHAGRIASWLLSVMAPFARANSLGEVVVDVLFKFPLPVDRNRRPDVAFVSYSRWPKGRVSKGGQNAWEVVPDLAIEVVSPNDLAESLIEKIEEY